MIDTSKVLNINNCYIITKTYNGSTYFYDSRRDSTDSDYAILYRSLEDATARCTQLNATRKKLKYSIRPAKEYFVNNFTIVVGSPWSGYEGGGVKVDNKPRSIANLIRNKIRLQKPDALVANIIGQIKNQKVKLVDDRNSRVDSNLREVASLQAQILQRNKDHYEYMTKQDVLLTELVSIETMVNALNPDELFKSFKTDKEETLEVLYGSKANEN